MIRAFLRWLYGEDYVPPHVCEEFTQWTKKTVRYTRRLNADDGLAYFNAITQGTIDTIQVNWIECYQERRCTLCGRIQQEQLEHFDGE